MIHCNDGSREHMLEADAAKTVIAAESKKRVAKTQANPTASKRMQPATLSKSDALSIGLEKGTQIHISEKTGTTAPNKPSKSRPFLRSIYSSA